MDVLSRLLPLPLIALGIYVTPQMTLQRNLDPGLLVLMALVGVGLTFPVRLLFRHDTPKVFAAAIVAAAAAKDLGQGYVMTARWDDATYTYAHLALFCQWCVVALAMWLAAHLLRMRPLFPAGSCPRCPHCRDRNRTASRHGHAADAVRRTP